MSWKNTAGQELLFVSSKAVLDGSKAIRGGVPICFPQFGMLGPLKAQHGFARTSRWGVVEQKPSSITLRLEPTPELVALWPYAFELEMTVEVGDDRLHQELVVRNTGDQPIQFTAALHTYFRVSHISKASIVGLAGVRYYDSLAGQEVEGSADKEVRFEGEVDRIYLSAPSTLKIADAGGAAGDHTAILVRKQGFQDAVVWNPWLYKARALADLGDEDYNHFLCLEVAQARSGAVTLEAGEEWRGGQTLEYAEHTDL